VDKILSADALFAALTSGLNGIKNTGNNGTGSSGGLTGLTDEGLFADILMSTMSSTKNASSDAHEIPSSPEQAVLLEAPFSQDEVSGASFDDSARSDTAFEASESVETNHSFGSEDVHSMESTVSEENSHAGGEYEISPDSREEVSAENTIEANEVQDVQSSPSSRSEGCSRSECGNEVAGREDKEKTSAADNTTKNTSGAVEDKAAPVHRTRRPERKSTPGITEADRKEMAEKLGISRKDLETLLTALANLGMEKLKEMAGGNEEAETLLQDLAALLAEQIQKLIGEKKAALKVSLKEEVADKSGPQELESIETENRELTGEIDRLQRMLDRLQRSLDRQVAETNVKHARSGVESSAVNASEKAAATPHKKSGKQLNSFITKVRSALIKQGRSTGKAPEIKKTPTAAVKPQEAGTKGETAGTEPEVNAVKLQEKIQPAEKENTAVGNQTGNTAGHEAQTTVETVGKNVDTTKETVTQKTGETAENMVAGKPGQADGGQTERKTEFKAERIDRPEKESGSRFTVKLGDKVSSKKAEGTKGSGKEKIKVYSAKNASQSAKTASAANKQTSTPRVLAKSAGEQTAQTGIENGNSGETDRFQNLDSRRLGTVNVHVETSRSEVSEAATGFTATEASRREFSVETAQRNQGNELEKALSAETTKVNAGDSTSGSGREGGLEARADGGFVTEAFGARATAGKTASGAQFGRDVIFNQVVQKFQALSSNGTVNTVRMQLNPEFLGQVEVRLTMRNGSLVAQINVENAVVKDVLDSSTQHLRQSLADAGVDVDSLDVNVSQGGLSWQHNEQNRFARSNTNKKRITIDELDELEGALNEPLVDLSLEAQMALNGGRLDLVA